MSEIIKFDKGKLKFEWIPSLIPQDPLRNVVLEGLDLYDHVVSFLQHTELRIGDPFRPSQRVVTFHTKIKEICNEVFEVIKVLKTADDEKIAAAYLASRLFEAFANYWIKEILNNGRHILGIGFWHSVLSIIKDWEQRNAPVTIHKGTPYYFLAENYLLIGDKDNGFLYQYNALDENKKLPEIGYPKQSPSYRTITLSNDPQNQMYPFIIQPLRSELEKFVILYKQKYNSNFNINDLDIKFLQNDNLMNTSYFFVYNFTVLHDLNERVRMGQNLNEFTKLRALDQFFNFALIIDEILKFQASRTQVPIKTMYDSVWWWIESTQNISKNDFDSLLGKNGFDLNNSEPNVVIPQLLQSIRNPQSTFDKKIFVMLLAYHMRNHAGHNIDQQDILISKYEEIIEQLFMALFLAIDLP